ncbi:alpha-taxilin-like [Tropilaelaps mercedesae]|uniref:Alpha-taxilin-like n=1 Tax=Tropilaelaps mercedesae TaxID=418985 RepID=A0A1V9XST9_9ACAR|nr:alpha-taxilin-like [Tropilaelaps mercedesae]
MSEVFFPIRQSSLGGKGGKRGKNKSGQKQSIQQKEPQLEIVTQQNESQLQHAPQQQVVSAPEAEKPLEEEVEDAANPIPDPDGAPSNHDLGSCCPVKEQEDDSGESIPKPANADTDQAKVAEDVGQSGEQCEVQGRVTAEQLDLVSKEKAALENQRMQDKDLRSLAKVLIHCKDTAQDIKGDVYKVLQERRSCEDECLQIEKNIGDKLAALKAEVRKSTKECMESMSEEVESETRTPISVPSGPSLGAAGGRERRANSKSATPPPSGVSGQEKERALLDRISDLSKQEPPKKLSASSKKKAIESVLRSLSDFQTTEDKLRALCELHYETLEQLRETQATTDKWRKQFQASQKENNRSLLARDRLEGLCRRHSQAIVDDVYLAAGSALPPAAITLGSHSKRLPLSFFVLVAPPPPSTHAELATEESALRRREEEEKRKHIAAKFQATLTDVSTLMADTQDTSAKLRQDNAQLASKLHSLVTHYDIWEKHSENMLKQKTIETELAMAKLREAQLLREKDFTEAEHSRKMLETAMKGMQCQLKASLRNELLLREQLKLHNDKYEEFQEAIVSSNKMFTDFKGEVESMGKQTRKFEKDALQWKQRWEEANLATARVFQEKTKSDLKVETLSRLCRSLQDKLRITNQDMADFEANVTNEVVAEEKLKLEQELARKQREIAEHKQALESRQRQAQSNLTKHVEVVEKVSAEMEQVLYSAVQTPVSKPAATTVTATLTDALSKESQVQLTAADASNDTKKDSNKKRNKRKH